VKDLRIVFGLIAALICQTTLLLRFDAVNFDLILIVVVFSALSRGHLVGLWSGAVSGFVQDVMSGGIIGVSGLAKSLAGVLVGLAGSQFLISTIWHRVAILMAASIFHVLCFMGVYLLIDQVSVSTFIPLAMEQAFLNGFIGAIILLVAAGFPRFGKKFRILTMFRSRN
tara:strand:- start:689 stop:1195 length:507 start_codon:yes stop_codon:yes gene_type:complete